MVSDKKIFLCVSLYKVMLHTKYQSSMPCGLREDDFFMFFLYNRLGPRVKKIKNGYLESSKDCYSINLKKYIWCIGNHCIASFSELHNTTRAKKVW